VLYAKDLHQLVQFYTAVAGLDLQKIDDGFAVLGSEPSQLVIVRIPKRIAVAFQIATPPERRESASIKLVFAAEDIAGMNSERGWQAHSGPEANLAPIPAIENSAVPARRHLQLPHG